MVLILLDVVVPYVPLFDLRGLSKLLSIFLVHSALELLRYWQLNSHCDLLLAQRRSVKRDDLRNKMNLAQWKTPDSVYFGRKVPGITDMNLKDQNELNEPRHSWLWMIHCYSTYLLHKTNFIRHPTILFDHNARPNSNITSIILYGAALEI